jgi:hypothetical protein
MRQVPWQRGEANERCGMDLLLILGGMALGGGAGWFAAWIVLPESSAAVQGAAALVGGMAGTVVGYVFSWLFKQLSSPVTTVKPAHEKPPQVVGSHCGKCGERLMMITDGHACPNCKRVFCLRCERKMPCSACRPKGKSLPPRYPRVKPPRMR